MDFGHLPVSMLAAVDFRLPPDNPRNVEVLRGIKAMKPQFFVGLTRWGSKDFIGSVYPKGTKDKQFVEWYSKFFNTVEVNSTHYTLPPASQIHDWAQKTGSRDFFFCPKVYNGISHNGILTDKKQLTQVFAEPLRSFGPKLGPMFLQLSEKFGPQRRDELIDYLHAWPADLRLFVELRNSGWFDNGVDETLTATLRKLGMGLVLTDTAGRRDILHMQLDVPSAFIRWVGNDGHSTDLPRLDEWVARIGSWTDAGLQSCFFFVHSNHDVHAPLLANHFIKALNARVGAGLPELNILF